MFRASMCPSSGEICCIYATLVFVTLNGWRLVCRADNSVHYIYLLIFSTCFGHPCAHHQEKIAVYMRHWYLSLSMGGV